MLSTTPVSTGAAQRAIDARTKGAAPEFPFRPGFSHRPHLRSPIGNLASLFFLLVHYSSPSIPSPRVPRPTPDPASLPAQPSVPPPPPRVSPRFRRTALHVLETRPVRSPFSIPGKTSAAPARRYLRQIDHRARSTRPARALCAITARRRPRIRGKCISSIAWIAWSVLPRVLSARTTAGSSHQQPLPRIGTPRRHGPPENPVCAPSLSRSLHTAPRGWCHGVRLAACVAGSGLRIE